MNDDTLYSIGELARRTGLAVRTIRFYSDRGVVPPTNRSPAGHRLYDLDALVRLDLVRTLRDLGVDLATTHRVLKREITVPEVAAAHAETAAAEHQAADRADGDQTGLHHDLTIYVRERVESALADGIDPAGEEARPVLAELIARYAETFDKTDTPAYREKLVTRLEVASDPLTERYWLLLTAVNGTPVPPSLAPVFGWFLTALRQHPNP